MARARHGDVVRVHYQGKLDDDTVLQSTHGALPAEFRLGMDASIPALEEALIGMEEGEAKEFRLDSREVYGSDPEALVFEVRRSEISPAFDPRPGKKIKVTLSSGSWLDFDVDDVTPDSVRLNANNALAGKEITFRVELVEIVSGG